jgi:hypothetical protein
MLLEGLMAKENLKINISKSKRFSKQAANVM